MHDSIQLQGLIGNEEERKKNLLIRVMVAKQFGHLLS